jgi:hypothetical protein
LLQQWNLCCSDNPHDKACDPKKMHLDNAPHGLTPAVVGSSVATQRTTVVCRSKKNGWLTKVEIRQTKARTRTHIKSVDSFAPASCRAYARAPLSLTPFFVSLDKVSNAAFFDDGLQIGLGGRGHPERDVYLGHHPCCAVPCLTPT